MSNRFKAVLSAVILGCTAASASHADIEISSTYNYRDREIGLDPQPGEWLLFGVAGLNPSTADGTVGTFSQGEVSDDLHPLSFDPSYLEGFTPYRESLSGPWQLTLRNGDQTRTVFTSGLLSNTPMPFAQSIAVSGSGLSPMVSWQRPAGVDLGSQDVSVLKFLPQANRYDVLLYNRMPSSDVSSYQIPQGILNSGEEYRIAINFFDSTFTQRSLTAVSYVPLSYDTGGENVFLPSIIAGDGGQPVFVFQPIPVVGGQPILIDPIVVEGYDYAIGAGDPAFASVVLPTGIGDNTYLLTFAGATVSVAGGVEFLFPDGGVEAFSVRGIETSAGLSPTDGTAFVTRVTFVDAGVFSGTMTPVTVEVPVPEPGTTLLVLLGLAAVSVASNRRIRRHRSLERLEAR